MSQKLIQNIYESFADQFKIKYSKPLSKEKLEKLIGALNLIDKNIHELISSYESALQSLSFIEKEKEMRIKFPDIWKMQLQQAKESAKSNKLQVINLGAKYQVRIDQIFKNHTNKKLSLEDFSEIN